MADLDLHLVRTYVAVVERGGFSAAGAAVGRSQPAISQMVRRLEDTLGARLIERTSRKFVLTPAGRWFLQQAKQLIETNDAIMAEASGSAVQDTLRVGLTEQYLDGELPDILRDFRRKHPRVKVEVTIGRSGRLLDALDSGRLDLAIGKIENARQGIPIREEALEWVTAEPELPAADPLPVAFMGSPCSYRSRATSALASRRIRWSQVFESESISAVVAAVRAGVCITVLDRSFIPADLTIAGPESRLPPLPPSRIGIFTSLDRPSLTAQSMVDIIKKRIGAI